MPESHLTSKGQITLPKAIREHLKVKTGDLVAFRVEENGQVTVSAVNAPLNSLKGIVPVADGRAVSLESMELAIRKRVR